MHASRGSLAFVLASFARTWLARQAARLREPAAFLPLSSRNRLIITRPTQPKDHLAEVLGKWHTLKANDDIWAKLIYFERNRRLAKAYVSASTLIVDASTAGLTAHNTRVGLSGLENPARSLESVACLRQLGAGVELRVDSAGNALISRAGNDRAPVFVASWPSQLDTEEPRQLRASNKSLKLFDMRRFRAKLDASSPHQLRNAWPLCVSLVSFARHGDELSAQRLLDNASWLLVINVIAVDLLKRLVASADAALSTDALLADPSPAPESITASQQSSGFQSSLSGSSSSTSSSSNAAKLLPRHHKSALQLSAGEASRRSVPSWRAPRPQLKPELACRKPTSKHLSQSNFDLSSGASYLRMHYENVDPSNDHYENHNMTVDAQIDRPLMYLTAGGEHTRRPDKQRPNGAESAVEAAERRKISMFSNNSSASSSGGDYSLSSLTSEPRSRKELTPASATPQDSCCEFCCYHDRGSRENDKQVHDIYNLPTADASKKQTGRWLSRTTSKILPKFMLSSSTDARSVHSRSLSQAPDKKTLAVR